MSRTVTVTEGRAFDHVYDPSNKLGSPKDFYRATEEAKHSKVIKVPVNNNLFSELNHYPKVLTKIGMSGVGLPLTLMQDNNNTEASSPTKTNPNISSSSPVTNGPVLQMNTLVTGQHRFKYFRKPEQGVDKTATLKLDPRVLTASDPSSAATTSLLRTVQAKPLSSTGIHGDATIFHADGNRSIGIQTLYRDSETQTDPFSPDYIVPQGTNPEILRLAFLKYGGEPGQSLPIGKADIEAVERARRRYAIEISLPPITDEASFNARKRLMELLELDTFEHKDNELTKANNARISLVEQALLNRDAERTFMIEQRVEDIRKRLEDETVNTLAGIQARRVKQLRKLGATRTKEEKHVDMLTGTGTFLGIGPVHASSTGKGRKPSRDIIADYADYGSKVYAPLRRDGAQRDKLPVAARYDHSAQAAPLRDAAGLEQLAATLPHTLLSVQTIRPGTVKNATAKDSSTQIASDLETVYNMIKTVQAGKSTTAIMNETVPAWRHPKPVIDRPSTPTLVDTYESMSQHDITEGLSSTPTDTELEQAVILLQSLLRGKASQYVMIDGKERRMELIMEMRADLLTDEAAIALAADEEARARAREIQVARTAVSDGAAGEVTAHALDFFAKELIRNREITRITAIATAADNERQRRETEEGERRREALHRRAVTVAVENATAQMYYDISSNLVDSIIRNSIIQHANTVAGNDTGLVPEVLGSIIANLEKESASLENSLGLPPSREAVLPYHLESKDDNGEYNTTNDVQNTSQLGPLDETMNTLDMTNNSLDLSESGDGEDERTKDDETNTGNNDGIHPEFAATKIQAVARGRKARKDVQQLRQSRSVPALDVNNESKNDLGTAFASDDITAADLTDAILAGLDPEAAATKIQSIARGRKARKQVAEKRRSVLLTTAEQTKLEAQEAMEENHLIVDPSQAIAATKIQSVARGRQARKTVQNLRNSRSVSGADEGDSKEDNEASPAVVDAVEGSPDAAEEEQKDDKDAHQAATKIQSVARGRQARKRVTNIRSGSNGSNDATATEAGDEGTVDEAKEEENTLNGNGEGETEAVPMNEESSVVPVDATTEGTQEEQTPGAE